MSEKREKKPVKDRTTIYLPPELRRRVGHYTVDTRETMTDLIIRLLTAHLDEYEREHK